MSRSQPKDSVPGADVVVATLSPRGDMTGRLVDAYEELARLSAEAGARYLQVGGFSSLRPSPDQPRFVEGEIPEPYRAEALEGEATRVLLAQRAPDELDWVFVSPAGGEVGHLRCRLRSRDRRLRARRRFVLLVERLQDLGEIG